MNPQSHIGLVFPLHKGGDGAHRAAASGSFSDAALEALDVAKITFLGDKPHFASAFHVLEQAMWGTNTMIAREAFLFARQNGINLSLLFGALANGAAGSQ